MDRRTFLGGAAAALAATRVPVAVARLQPVPSFDADPFALGVASGDPTSSAVVIWTRLAPDPLDAAATPSVDVPVTWEVATDEGFSGVVASGTAVAAAEHAHSVHVDVGGLDPDSWYWYRFSAAGYDSVVGRTRTVPAGTCTETPCRFGFASCQNWTDGYYPAHDHLAAEQLDLVFWLGDYIYEGGVGSGVRPHNSDEPQTLDEYRNRYGLYKGDPALQSSHAAFPWVVIWDDHEVENNYAADRDQNGSDPSSFLVRRAAAYKAWWEHQPVRLAPPTGPDLRIYRRFAWGDLAAFFALDGRQYRSDQACGDVLGDCPERTDPARTMLGAAEQSWLTDGLGSSTAVWNVLANQVVMTGLPLGGAYNLDQWDGYPAGRERLFEVLGRPEVGNPLVITGDIHASGIADLTSGPDAPVVGTELVTTSISSDFDAGLADLAEIVIGALPWVRFVDTHHRGYVTVDLTRERAEATYRFVESALEPSSPAFVGTTYTIEAGEAGLAECRPVTESPATPTTPAALPTAATPAFTG